MTIVRSVFIWRSAMLLVFGAGAGCAGFIQPPKASRPPTSAEPPATVVAPASATARAPEPDQPAATSATPTAPRAAAPAAAPAVLLTRPAELDAALERRRRTLVAGCRGLPADEIGYYLDVLAARLRQLRINGLVAARQELRILVELSDPAMFDGASAVLSSDARQSLSHLRPILADYDQTLITVHAHTGATAQSATDQRLAEQRAIVVALQFTAGGIATRRLVAVGHGGVAAPTAANADASTPALIVLWLDPVRLTDPNCRDPRF